MAHGPVVVHGQTAAHDRAVLHGPVMACGLVVVPNQFVSYDQAVAQAARLLDQGQALATVCLATSLAAHPNHPAAHLGDPVVLKILERLERLTVELAPDQRTLCHSTGCLAAGSPAVCPAVHHGEPANDLLVVLCQTEGHMDNHQQ